MRVGTQSIRNMSALILFAVRLNIRRQSNYDSNFLDNNVALF